MNSIPTVEPSHVASEVEWPEKSHEYTICASNLAFVLRIFISQLSQRKASPLLDLCMLLVQSHGLQNHINTIRISNLAFVLGLFIGQLC